MRLLWPPVQVEHLTTDYNRYMKITSRQRVHAIRRVLLSCAAASREEEPTRRSVLKAIFRAAAVQRHLCLYPIASPALYSLAPRSSGHAQEAHLLFHVQSCARDRQFGGVRSPIPRNASYLRLL